MLAAESDGKGVDVPPTDISLGPDGNGEGIWIDEGGYEYLYKSMALFVSLFSLPPLNVSNACSRAIKRTSSLWYLTAGVANVELLHIPTLLTYVAHMRRNGLALTNLIRRSQILILAPARTPSFRADCKLQRSRKVKYDRAKDGCCGH